VVLYEAYLLKMLSITENGHQLHFVNTRSPKYSICPDTGSTPEQLTEQVAEELPDRLQRGAGLLYRLGRGGRRRRRSRSSRSTCRRRRGLLGDGGGRLRPSVDAGRYPQQAVFGVCAQRSHAQRQPHRFTGQRGEVDVDLGVFPVVELAHRPQVGGLARVVQVADAEERRAGRRVGLTACEGAQMIAGQDEEIGIASGDAPVHRAGVHSNRRVTGRCAVLEGRDRDAVFRLGVGPWAGNCYIVCTPLC